MLSGFVIALTAMLRELHALPWGHPSMRDEGFRH